MAKIPLRAYFREIEGLIEHGQLDEATAHCKHILQFYPKIIAAYRLLGKTYLEDQRYSDAADIFQRVLSSVPDDFVSNVGMSIIREDEGNLDAAIWHMERAFEVQPYNAAIQDELRRLFQRRDNVEPHKIRLTRGALARMYAKGDLYQQAIAELHAAQSEDAQRPDLQILLARMYYLSGMLVESVDMCSTLLKKLPYCLEANRLLGAILPTTERKDEAKVYQQRVASLDPYLAAAPITTTSADRVPDNIAVIDKYEYRPNAPEAEAPSQPAWASSLGVSLEGFTPKEEPLPDWMTTDEQETTPPGKDKATVREETAEKPDTTRLPWETPSEAGSGIPDWMSTSRLGTDETGGNKTPAVTGSLIPGWMKEAGWEPSSGSKEEPPSETIPLEGETQPDAGIAPADIPDWLRAIAPPTAMQGQPEEEAQLPWEQASPSGTGEEIPDWLKSLENEAPVEGLTGEPALDQQKKVEPESQEWQFEAPTPGAPLTPTQETPDWLSSIEEEVSASEGDVIGETRPTPLQEAASAMPLSEEAQTPEVTAPPIPEPAAPEVPASEPSVPESMAAQPTASEPGFDLSNQDAALAWLESLAAKQGISEDQLLTRPEDRTGELPDWLREDKVSETPPEERQAPVSIPVQPKTEPAEWMPETPATAETAEAPAEAPAAETKQEPAELEPEGQSGLPGWLQGAMSEKAPSEEAQPGEVAEQALELPDWLQEAITKETAESAASQDMGAEEQVELPDWLKGLGEQPAQGESLPETPVAADVTPGPDISEPVIIEAEASLTPTPEPVAPQPTPAEPGFDLTDQDAALAWLESLAAKQGVSEDQLFTRPVDRAQELPAKREEVSPVPEEAPKLGDTQPISKPQAPVPEMGEAWPVPSEKVPEPVEISTAPTEEIETVEPAPLEAITEATQPEEAVSEPVVLPVEAVEEPVSELRPATVEEIAPAAPEKPTPELQILETTPTETEPELPSWIAEIASGQPEEEEYAWMPPAIAAEAAMAETAPEPETPIEPAPVEQAPTARIPLSTKPSDKEAETRFNINSASLIELENLPGVGFIQAQSILAYREEHGPFEQIDDLTKVPGFNPAVLDDIRDRLTTGVQEKATAPEFVELKPEDADPDQAVLIQARNALIQENVSETVTRYTYLIKRERMLDTVIRDLYEALYHFPMDVSIWQTLGDAYVRNNQLQEALDAYIKAEELLR